MADTMDASIATGDNINVNESVLRKRNPWNSLVSDGIDLLADVDELDDEEEEDGNYLLLFSWKQKENNHC